MQGARVQSLVEELRAHIPHGTAKRKEKARMAGVQVDREGEGLNEVREVGRPSATEWSLAFICKPCAGCCGALRSLQPSAGDSLGHQQLHSRWDGIVLALRSCPSLGSLEAELEKRNVGMRLLGEVMDHKDQRTETGKEEKGI